jgi:transcription-repair coupling factor (superfamily II helicase)
MQVKLRAERAGLISVGMESGQVVLRYSALSESSETKTGTNIPNGHLPDLGPGIRGGKNAYWCTFGKDPDWQTRLLEVLEKLEK